tara:strand:- start:2230 stop:2613 length:384 start_codon:yes stop_codon:yes gene_type:complete
MNLKDFGKNLNLKQKQPISNNTKQFFIDIVTLFDGVYQRTVEMDSFGIDMETYDDGFYVLIENLILKTYGEWKTELILWYIYDRFNENEELMPLTLQEEEQDEEEIFVETPEQLWDLIKKIDKKSKK